MKSELRPHGEIRGPFPKYPVDTTRKESYAMADRPAHREAPDSEIEITPEMIEAGVCVLWESGAVEHPMQDHDRALVREIYLAMDRALIKASMSRNKSSDI